MQLSFNNGFLNGSRRRSSTMMGSAKPARGRKQKTLVELKHGENGVLDRLDLPEDVARRLMELGFLPGHVVSRGLSAPGGDPRVFRVDGSEVALRRETAAHVYLRADESL
jgi:ferrous iron transport protein A